MTEHQTGGEPRPEAAAQFDYKQAFEEAQTAEPPAAEAPEPGGDVNWNHKAVDSVNMLRNLADDPLIIAEFGADKAAALGAEARLLAEINNDTPDEAGKREIVSAAYAAVDRMLPGLADAGPEQTAAEPVPPQVAPAAHERAQAAREVIAAQEAQPDTPERGQEAPLDPEFIGSKLTAGTVEIFVAAPITRDEARAYREAAEAKGRSLGNTDLESTGGWKKISDVAEGTVPPPPIEVMNYGMTGEDLQMVPRTRDNEPEGPAVFHDELVPGGTHEPSVRVTYNYKNTMGDPLGVNERGGSYIRDDGRAQILTVAFDVPESVAKKIAEAAKSDPQSVRDIVEKVVIGTGMPEEVWSARSASRPPIKPLYSKPAPDYEITVNASLKPDWAR